MNTTTMLPSRQSACKWAWAILACAMLAACGSPRRAPAPVEDRGTSARPAVVAAQPAPAQPVRDPGANQAGYYTVKPGDTLIRIGLENGQNWRDVARWNNIDNPNPVSYTHLTLPTNREV